MSKNLVIVESPAKIKTLKKYLVGKDFEIMASFGHVRDLIPKEGAVEPDNDFAMHYQIGEKSVKQVDTICKAMKTAKALYLATDPDREGEAIAWHLCEIMRQKKVLKDVPIHRITFHEITKTAILQALDSPTELSMDLVRAQQARRALDYLVGFNLSPLLWKKIRRGLSAGRVQSPALRMIVEREQEIEKFVSKEYWTIEADLKTGKEEFASKLVEYSGEKLQQFSITNAEKAAEVADNLLKAANGNLTVSKVTKSKRKRNPAAPFITSTLQQEAVRKLGFSAQKTMRVAQQLYEGIDIGSGAEGLITYMRTDSVNLAKEALAQIRDLIAERYGDKALPSSVRIFKKKSKNAQEAHEAIRPTSVNILPSKIKNKLTLDQYKLYNLIWQRTVACQMQHATIDQVAVDLSCGTGNTFRANGSVIADPGFMQVYYEGVDDSKIDVGDKLLPPLKEGDVVDLTKIRKEQHFTEPPPRYSEATLVKSLEEHGIGRPSTYATIISTLQQRQYVTLENKRFKPTDVGRIVSKFLTAYFSRYVNYDFTAQLEDNLDELARGERALVPLLSEFWEPFIKLLRGIEQTVQRKDITHEKTEEKCPECGKELAIQLGRNGRFIGCSGYPDCKYTRSLESASDEEQAAVKDKQCPKCEKPLVLRFGKYGKFIGCSGYPECKYIESLHKPADTNVTCPSCKKGTLMKRKSRYGTFFYACSGYPSCKYSVRHEPIAEKCTSCDWPILTIKETKRKGKQKVCPQKSCGFVEGID